MQAWSVGPPGLPWLLPKAFLVVDLNQVHPKLVVVDKFFGYLVVPAIALGQPMSQQLLWYSLNLVSKVKGQSRFVVSN